MALTVRRPADEAELAALTDLLCVSFNAPEAGIATSLERVGAENQRVAHDGSAILGGLWQIPMGQWFGGRSVPMTGIGAVGIEPGARGTGVGAELMAATVRELHQRAVPLSCLYPATVPFYRRAGYELAGSRYRAAVSLKGVRAKASAGALRAADASDHAAMEACYRRFASQQSGLLDRGSFIWGRVRQPRGESARSWVFEQDGQLSAYATLLLKDDPGGRVGYEVHLSDLVATSPDGVAALLAFLSGYRSMSEQAVFFGDPRHPVLLALPDGHPRVELHLHWMLRVTHVAAALSARGWPAGVQAELSLQVDDELLPHNGGHYRLAVDAGQVEVQRVEAAGPGRVRLSVRALAALYSGFLSPAELQRLGWLSGPSDDLSRLATLFAGPAPWMCDMF